MIRYQVRYYCHSHNDSTQKSLHIVECVNFERACKIATSFSDCDPVIETVVVTDCVKVTETKSYSIQSAKPMTL